MELILTSRGCLSGNLLMNRARCQTQTQKSGSAASRLLGSWGKNRDQAPAVPIRPERILIVTEGTKTEPYYFAGFQRRINDAFGGEYITIEVVGMGENTVSLFKSAKEMAEESLDGYTQVWIVYDKDNFPANDFNAVEELCRSASGNGTFYRAAWSNESFELWFLLHFCFIDTALGRAAYSKRLTAYLKSEGLGKYQKNREDLFEVFESRMRVALSNAERLAEVNQGKTPAQSNPGTTVHLLVKELIPYLGIGAYAEVDLS